MTGRGEAHRDGDGWVECAQGHRHWGRFGAAGLLLYRTADAGRIELLLQHRAEWSHHGGTWGLLGGARHRDEATVATALREAAEESGLRAEAVQVNGLYVDDHGGWSYTTVVAVGVGDAEARAASRETVEVGWWSVDRLSELPVHPGFASSWPTLRAATVPLTIVVDAANVMGTRPDGWWKDRPAAAGRLVRDVSTMCDLGVDDGALPTPLDRPTLQRWWPRAVVVVEGAARAAATPSSAGGFGDRVRVVAAPGSGDDAIVAEVAGAGAGPRVVVTADRELRARCEAAGGVSVGPRWLLGLLDRTARSPG